MPQDEFRFDVAYALGKVDKATIRDLLDRQTAEAARARIAGKIIEHLALCGVTLTGRQITAQDYRSAHTRYAGKGED